MPRDAESRCSLDDPFLAQTLDDVPRHHAGQLHLGTLLAQGVLDDRPGPAITGRAAARVVAARIDRATHVLAFVVAASVGYAIGDRVRAFAVGALAPLAPIRFLWTVWPTHARTLHAIATRVAGAVLALDAVAARSIPPFTVWDAILSRVHNVSQSR